VTLNILTVSTLYPNNKEPKHGIFVRNRLMQLRKDFADVKATVIAPVPWFPFKVSSGPLAEYAKFAGVDNEELRDGIEVLHPRYLVIPKIGMYITPFFLYLAMRSAFKRLEKRGAKFDLIDGHYFFPDGVAIARLAAKVKLPFTVTARGTDVNLIPQFPKARAMISEVANKASAAITVCKALKDSLLEFADVAEKTHVLRNGVDLEFFTSTSAEQQISLKSKIWQIPENKKLILSVGHLIERKGHGLVIESLLSLPECMLLIAGDGPDLALLKSQVEKYDLSDRVKFLGALSQSELRTLYQSADALVLASSREGWANVLLESMACGTAVVATNLWGTPEVVASPVAGVLVDRDANAIAAGLNTLFTANIQRADTRLYAEQFDWFSTSEGQYQIFTEIKQRSVATEPQQLAVKDN
jgi:glycosyltransferase involved in cell wall biosynthesis